MRRHTHIPMAVMFSVGLLLSMVTLAHAGPREVTVSQFTVVLYGTSLGTYIEINSTGDIGPLDYKISYGDADSGDALDTVTAFADLAHSLGCTVGPVQASLYIPGMPDPGDEGFKVECVCEDWRSKLVHKTGKMLRFPLTLPYNH